MNSNIKKAIGIARVNLHKCYTDEGILAGQKNFIDFWARDSFWAIMGSIKLGDYDQVERNFNQFLDLQRKNGQIPYRIISVNQFLKYLRIKKRFKKPIPNYNSIMGASVIDQNSLLIIAAAEYSKNMRGKKYIRDIFPKLENAFLWLKKQTSPRFGLIREGLFANWMDHVFKSGIVLNNNVLYYKASAAMAFISHGLDNQKQQKRYKRVADKIKKKIDEHLYNGVFYLDWKDFKDHHYFETASNLLTIIWRVANKNNSEKILDLIEKKLYKGFVPKANFPSYHPFLVLPQHYIAGVYDYAGYRIWIGALYALALKRNGAQDKAQKAMEKIAKKIIKHKTIHEIYTPKGEPAKHPLYINESPFSWSAGVFIWACSEIYENIDNILDIE